MGNLPEDQMFPSDISDMLNELTARHLEFDRLKALGSDVRVDRVESAGEDLRCAWVAFCRAVRGEPA